MKYADQPWVGGHPVKREFLRVKPCATCGTVTPCNYSLLAGDWFCSTECTDLGVIGEARKIVARAEKKELHE